MSYEDDGLAAEPNDALVPTAPVKDVTLEDVYNVLVDLHRMEVRKLSIMEGAVAVINEAGPLIAEARQHIGPLMESLQESPLFGMLSGQGGGLLGGLFRR